MTLRYIDTAIWTDPWFEELTPDGKLIFIYSWSNDHMNAAGCTSISPKRIGLEVGITEPKVKQALETLHPKVIYFEDFNILWAVKFLSKQTKAETFLIKVGKDLEKMPDSVAATVYAAYDNLSIPYTPCAEVIDNLTVLYCTNTDNSFKRNELKEKLTFAENVKMTQKEYDTLVADHGERKTKAFINKLNNHKSSNGKKYKSDYHAILNWVIEAVGAGNGSTPSRNIEQENKAKADKCFADHKTTDFMDCPEPLPGHKVCIHCDHEKRDGSCPCKDCHMSPEEKKKRLASLTAGIGRKVT